MNTTSTMSDLQAELNALRAQKEALEAALAKKNAGRGKDAPAYIKNGLVNFPGVASMTGLHLNPDAFLSIVERLPAVLAEFKANEAQIRAEYAARPAFKK